MYYDHKPGYHYYPDCTQPYRSLPPVNPNLLCHSAKESKSLLTDVNKVVHEFENNKDFDTQLMTAAQDSNFKEVNRLIYSLGLTSEVTIKFNPDGIHLEFRPKEPNPKIASITIALRWR